MILHKTPEGKQKQTVVTTLQLLRDVVEFLLDVFLLFFLFRLSNPLSKRIESESFFGFYFSAVKQLKPCRRFNGLGEGGGGQWIYEPVLASFNKSLQVPVYPVRPSSNTCTASDQNTQNKIDRILQQNTLTQSVSGSNITPCLFSCCLQQ